MSAIQIEPVIRRHSRACPGHPRLTCWMQQERRGCPRQARAWCWRSDPISSECAL